MASTARKLERVDGDAEALLQRTLAECGELAGRVKDLLRLVDGLVGVLPPERRIYYAQCMAPFRAIARPVRGVPLNDNIIAILAEKQELTAAAVRERLLDQGVPVDQKRVNNSLDYLARTGQLRRIGRGRYVIPGANVGIEGDLGEGYE